jgi:hypothetical protein
MKAEITPDRKRLTIITETSDKIPLEEARDIYEALENLIANSHFDWINPADTGDLTDAPMLGIYGTEFTAPAGKSPTVAWMERFPWKKASPIGFVHAGQSERGSHWMPILERWAFMDYQVKDELETLKETGRLTFIA